MTSIRARAPLHARGCSTLLACRSSPPDAASVPEQQSTHQSKLCGSTDGWTQASQSLRHDHRWTCAHGSARRCMLRAACRCCHHHKVRWFSKKNPPVVDDQQGAAPVPVDSRSAFQRCRLTANDDAASASATASTLGSMPGVRVPSLTSPIHAPWSWHEPDRRPRAYVLHSGRRRGNLFKF